MFLINIFTFGLLLEQPLGAFSNCGKQFRDFHLRELASFEIALIICCLIQACHSLNNFHTRCHLEYHRHHHHHYHHNYQIVFTKWQFSTHHPTHGKLSHKLTIEVRHLWMLLLFHEFLK